MRGTGPVEPDENNNQNNNKPMLLIALSAIIGILLIVFGYPSVLFATVGCLGILIAILLLIAE